MRSPRFMSRSLRFLVLYLLCLPPAAGAAALHHDLQVAIDPARHTLEVTDSITLPAGAAETFEFALHPELEPEMLTAGVRLVELSPGQGNRPPAQNTAANPARVTPRRYQVRRPAGSNSFSLRYHGHIRHALQQQGGEYARGFRETAGMISEQGVYLAGRSYWYPQSAGQFVSFDIDLQLPVGWSAMTQGARIERTAAPEGVRERWRCDSPQEEIYLIAGRYTEYLQSTHGVQARVLLREPDAALAQRYLEVTGDYIRLYSDLIGPYPYAGFALVENFWETGYGMPGFTLLGPKVIRLPFILHSSYPHEILHNWWGNSVYVDYRQGNWAEGLTSYLADHLIKEQRGQGMSYRRDVLQKYTDFVRRQQDFPLTAFRSRHSSVTEAVGYGKTLMLFHMLRNRLGDENFIRGLQALYRQYRFRVADFADVERVFGEASGRALEAFFAQWIERKGAPRLRVTDARARPQGGGFVLSARIEQTQAGAPYRLRVPIAVHLAGETQAWQTHVLLDDKSTALELELPVRPYRLAVDPEFDLFRRLHRNEIPPAVTQAQGAERVLLVLPAAAPAALREAYEKLARAWPAGNPERNAVIYDNELERLPDDRTVWLLGWRNRFRPQLAAALVAYDFEDGGDRVRIGETSLNRDEHALVILARQPSSADYALGWLAAGEAAALPGLGRKLPHYGKYSYLAFTGTTPDNVLKGQWPVVDSPLSVPVVQEDGRQVTPGNVQLAPRTPLAAAPVLFSPERMQRDIAVLADAAMLGRSVGSPELDRAAAYIAGEFSAAGLQPGGDGGDSWLQVWEAQVPELGRPVTLQNVIGVLPGSDPARTGESLVIGAHYDHLGRGEYGTGSGDRGRIHPGADDNASGIAVMLELARALAGKPRPRSIVFVAFTGEETGRLGSRYYVQQARRYPVGKAIAMVNLDTVGRLGKRPLTVLGTASAEEWEHILRGAGYVTGVAIRNVADDIGSGDQTSFIAAGVPAVQLFSGTHEDFHRPGDTPDRIDADGLEKTAQVLKEVTDYLARRPQALASTLGSDQAIAAAPDAGQRRRVSLGTVPDYAWNGNGVRLDGVGAGSPAGQAGLRQGDIITAVNGAPVRNLREYSQALRKLEPGDEVRIRLRRGDGQLNVSTRVVTR